MDKSARITYTLKLAILILCFFKNDGINSQLIDYQKVGHFTKDSLKEIWKIKKIPKSIVSIKTGITLYRVKYYTKWINGDKIVATGSIYVPDRSKNNPLLVYNHGTRIKKGPPKILGGENILAMLFSTDGYNVICPDYIGLGDGEKSHLYCHIESQASAGIDFIKITNEILQDLNKPPYSSLFISGYSQGGHAALSQQFVLERDYPNMKITASSPMSGPYDLSGVQEKVMYKPYTYSSYLPYLLLSLNTAYQLFDEESFYKIFKPPYDSVAKHMYNGDYKLRKINNLLPEIPVDMVQDAFVFRYNKDPDFELKKLLKLNDLSNWLPKSPVQLCYCEADEVVLYENALVTYENMKRLGAKKVYLKSGGKKFSHGKCAGTSSVYAKFFFDGYVKNKKIFKKGPIHKRLLLSIYKMLNS